ncbi:aldehyde dehydrogenase family protein, partial [Moorena sp. SIO3A5]
MGIATVNPATGETIKTFEPESPSSIATKLAVAQEAFEQYCQTSMEQRAEWLNAAAEIVERDRVKFGTLMTTEMGKPLKSAIAEAQKCALVCRYYAEHAAE